MTDDAGFTALIGGVGVLLIFGSIVTAIGYGILLVFQSQGVAVGILSVFLTGLILFITALFVDEVLKA